MPPVVATRRGRCRAFRHTPPVLALRVVPVKERSARWAAYPHANDVRAGAYLHAARTL